MEYFENVFVGHQVQERAQIYVFSQNIYRSRFIFIRELYQAQLRPIGFFPHEFGINGDVRSVREATAKEGERLRVVDDSHASFVHNLSRHKKAEGFYSIKRLGNGPGVRMAFGGIKSRSLAVSGLFLSVRGADARSASQPTHKRTDGNLTFGRSEIPQQRRVPSGVLG